MLRVTRHETVLLMERGRGWGGEEVVPGTAQY